MRIASNKDWEPVDIVVSQELLNYNFDEVEPLNRWATAERLKFPVEIFGEMRSYGVVITSPAYRTTFENSIKSKSMVMHFSADEDEYAINKLLLDEVKKLESCMNAQCISAVYDALPAGSIINEHTDKAEMYKHCYRIHIPIITDPAVKVILSGNEYHFKAGECFVFDNTKPHKVINGSNITRIHAVVDLMPLELLQE